jgi:hypothetical protein
MGKRRRSRSGAADDHGLAPDRRAHTIQLRRQGLLVADVADVGLCRAPRVSGAAARGTPYLLAPTCASRIQLLVYVLLALMPEIRAYADLVIPTSRNSRTAATQQRKLSSADLESALIRAKPFAPNSGLRCNAPVRDWDYVCSYMPTPLQSTTRVEFGVTVDEKRWLGVSRIVPAGSVLPPPITASPPR